jgi:phosphoglycerate dehydrogenase-like enzyme
MRPANSKQLPRPVKEGHMKILLMPRENIWPVILPEQVERIKAAGVENIVVAEDRESVLREVRDADVLIGEIDPEILEHAGRLRWMQSLSSGVDQFMFPEFIESDIVLTAEKGLVGPHLADHAFGLLLALTRSIAWAARQRTWENRGPMRRNNRELTGLTVGIIGLGGTGVAVAKRAEAFGMRCLAVDPDVTEAPAMVEKLVTPDRLLEIAAECDVIIVCCPRTKETLGIIGSAVFDAMRPGGYVVSVTRGGIIDEAALMAALDSGKLAGAGLDVASAEPLPSDNPLWGYDNVMITPHTAGASQHRIPRIIERVMTNIERFQRGEELEGVVDKNKGY